MTSIRATVMDRQIQIHTILNPALKQSGKWKRYLGTRESRVRERGRGGGVSDTTSKGFAKAITITFAREM